MIEIVTITNTQRCFPSYWTAWDTDGNMYAITYDAGELAVTGHDSSDHDVTIECSEREQAAGLPYDELAAALAGRFRLPPDEVIG
jgi:hypothetical protein|tara:strand:- start:800 stop:1054 length:255 start_codon:yes stop_codon:yes gene_type:complete